MSIGFVGVLKKDPTARSLLFANLITLVLAVVFSWNLLELMWIYLAQSVIIGFFNFLKMLSVSFSPESNGLLKAMGVFMSFFFLIHYGFGTKLGCFIVLG